MGFTAAFAGAFTQDVLDLHVDGILAPAEVVAFLIIGDEEKRLDGLSLIDTQEV